MAEEDNAGKVPEEQQGQQQQEQQQEQREVGGGGKTKGKGKRSSPESHRDLAFLEKSGFEIVKITEKHGQFRKAVPTMPLPLAIFCLFLNIVLPGTGTLVSAFAVFSCPTEYDTKSEAFVNNLIAALLQVLTLIILVGYIWSILWGVIFVSVALDTDKNEKDQKTEDSNVPEPTKV